MGTKADPFLLSHKTCLCVYILIGCASRITCGAVGREFNSCTRPPHPVFSDVPFLGTSGLEFEEGPANLLKSPTGDSEGLSPSIPATVAGDGAGGGESQTPANSPAVHFRVAERPLP